MLDATGTRPLVDRTLPMERRPRRASPPWRRVTSSARSSSPDEAPTSLTGAGSGIGAGARPALHERGDDLVLLARSDARAAELAADVPGRAMLVADLADPGALERRSAAAALPERLDSLLHVAGVVDLGAGRRARLARLAASRSTSTSPRRRVLTRALLPALRAARGTVVFVNSGAGLTRQPGRGRRTPPRSSGCAPSPTRCAPRRPSTASGSHGLPEPHGHADAGEGARAGGQGRTTPRDWITPETVADTILHVLDLPRRRHHPRGDVRPWCRARQARPGPARRPGIRRLDASPIRVAGSWR